MKTKLKRYRLADILSDHFRTYIYDPKKRLALEQKHFTAVNWIEACRSPKLGIGYYSCKNCEEGHHFVYRSCHHRFCPTCGISETNRWSEKMLSGLLRMKHHHIVMTLPKPLRMLSKKNGDIIHKELFKQSAAVLKSWFGSRHRLVPGIVSVLHTSGSDLKYHPHVHMIVSGGGRELNGESYHELEGDYLVPQYFLGKQLRYRMIKSLLELYRKGKLKSYDSHKDELSFELWLRSIKQKHWVVSIQDPLSDVNAIVRYVGRYTKRCCLSEYRIEHVGKDEVVISYNDYKNSERGSKPKQGLKSFSKTGFLDELLQHVPNKGFQMVRYYGLYAQMYRIPEEEKHNVVELKDVELQGDWTEYERYRKTMLRLKKQDPFECEYCGSLMKLTGIVIAGGEYIETG